MNANELADKLEARVMSELPLNQAATMLRQQQAEIEALKETLQGRDRYIDLLMEAQEK